MTQTPPPGGTGRRAAVALASGARDAAELRTWLRMAGLTPETPPGAVTLPAVTARRCTKCGYLKAVSEFYRRASARDGLDSHCRACRAAYHRDYMARHPEARKAATEATRRRRASRRRAAAPDASVPLPVPAALADVLGAEAGARGVTVEDLLREMAGTAA